MKNKSKILKILMIIFLLLPYLMPVYILRIGNMNEFVKYWKIATSLYAFVYLAKEKKISKLILCLITMYMVMLVSALIHGNNILDILNDAAFLLIISFLNTNKDRFKLFCDGYIFIMSIFIIINFVTMILFPNGLYSTIYEANWFLTYKNGLIRQILPYIVLAYSTSYNKKNILVKITIICGILSIIMSKSFNSYIGLIVFYIAFLVLKKGKNITKKISLMKIFTVYTIIDIIILNSNLITHFNNFIVNTLDKNGSMLGRFSIWEATIKMIYQSPIIGYGGIPSNLYNFAFNITHPHNLLLYYLMFGGILGTAILVFAVRIVDKKIIDKRNIQNIAILSFYISCLSMGFLESLIGIKFLIPFLPILYSLNENSQEE